MFVLKHFFGLFYLFLCFNMFLYFILFLHLFVFRINFSAITVCTETFISGVPGVRLRRSNNRRKAKRESYDFHVGVEVRSEPIIPSFAFKAAALYILSFGSISNGPGFCF